MTAKLDIIQSQTLRDPFAGKLFSRSIQRLSPELLKLLVVCLSNQWSSGPKAEEANAGTLLISTIGGNPLLVVGMV